MPRRLLLPTRELKDLDLLLIYSKAGKWESSWVELQATDFSDLVTTVTKEVMDHAMRGWTQPLVKGLGLAPSGAIRKLPQVYSLCAARAKCPMYDAKQCIPTHKKMPWCFQPDALKTDEQRRLGAEVVQLWREGVYVVVVDEP